MEEQTDILSGEVQSMAFGGLGIVRQNGLVVFVPFTVDWDFISYQITGKKKNFATAKLIKIIHPSPNRTSPRCPYYEACGGCQMQHIKYDHQLAIKHGNIEDILRRIGKINTEAIPIERSNLEWAYRRHVTLTLVPHQGGFLAGYTATDNVSIIKVECCPIFVEPQDAILQHVQKVVSQLKPESDNSGRLLILKHVMDKYILYFQFDRMPKNCRELLSRPPFPNWEGIIVSSPEEEFSVGATEITWQIDAFLFRLSPKTFIQNHPEQSASIYRKIDFYANKLKPKKALDLYCGSGITSVFLASNGAKVIGVESNERSIKLAEKNAADNKIEQAEFICAPVESVIKSLLKQHKPDMVVANPPRSGLHEKVIDALLASSAKHLIYISCMPPTLARDLSKLCAQHYIIKEIRAYDMFPQTMHVETVVCLQRK